MARARERVQIIQQRRARGLDIVVVGNDAAHLAVKNEWLYPRRAIAVELQLLDEPNIVAAIETEQVPIIGGLKNLGHSVNPPALQALGQFFGVAFEGVAQRLEVFGVLKD